MKNVTPAKFEWSIRSMVEYLLFDSELSRKSAKDFAVSKIKSAKDTNEVYFWGNVAKRC